MAVFKRPLNKYQKMLLNIPLNKKVYFKNLTQQKFEGVWREIDHNSLVPDYDLIVSEDFQSFKRVKHEITKYED